jgi:hypothetical protein
MWLKNPKFPMEEIVYSWRRANSALQMLLYFHTSEELFLSELLERIRDQNYGISYRMCSVIRDLERCGTRCLKTSMFSENGT